jgi:hypothetical protein
MALSNPSQRRHPHSKSTNLRRRRGIRRPTSPSHRKPTRNLHPPIPRNEAPKSRRPKCPLRRTHEPASRSAHRAPPILATTHSPQGPPRQRPGLLNSPTRIRNMERLHLIPPEALHQLPPLSKAPECAGKRRNKLVQNQRRSRSRHNLAIRQQTPLG